MATPHLRDRQYAMVWQQYGVSGDTMVGMRYLGHATLGGVTFRQTGCGMGGGMVASTGLSGAIGSTSVATISYSSGLVGWVLGLPMSAPIAGCSGCTQGSTAMVTTIGPATTVQIPYDGAFVGLTLALQPFAFGPGTCLGSLAFGDTIDLTIR
jgi:hypothetical protein